MIARRTATVFKMINWARFQDETVRLGGSTLFTGVNGSGKSTILDAITYLLIGNTQFNKAARDRDRNVTAYVRGDTKSNGSDRYLREGAVISYLAAEFHSEMENTSFTVGVCIESPDETDYTAHWFICQDTRIADITFTKTENGRRVVFPRNQLEAKGKRIPLSSFIPREKAVRQVMRALGLRCDASKYKSKLVKMMAFDPQSDVDKFIQDCVLDPGKVDSLAQVREQKEKNDELMAFYQTLLVSKRKLDELEKATAAFENKSRQLKSRTMMFAYQTYMKLLEEEKDSANRTAFLENKKKELEKEYTLSGDRVKAALERVNAAQSNTLFGEVKGSLSEIDKQMALLDKDISLYETDAAKALRLTESLRRLFETFGEEEIVTEELVQEAKTFGEEASEPDVQRKAFIKTADAFAVHKELLNAEKYRLSDRIKEIKQELVSLAREKEKLESNIMTYPKEAEQGKRIIKEQLAKIGIDTEVRFFAELVKEISDESWRKSIEAFLGRKRFFIIVDGKYCLEAMRIVREHKLFGVNVVITDKLPDTERIEKSAAELLEIPNVYARKYADYLLGRIRLCDTTEELHEYPKGGITKDGMLAKSYAVSMMRTKDLKYYLGTDAIRLRTQQLGREIEDNNIILKADQEKEGELTKSIKLIEEIDWNPGNYSFDAPGKLKAAQSERKELEEQKKKIENTPGLAAVMEEMKLADEAHTKAIGERERIYGEMSVCDSDLENERKKEKQIKELSKEAKYSYEEIAAGEPSVDSEMKEEYEKLKTRKGSVIVLTEKTVKNLENEKAQALHSMEDVQIECARLLEGDLNKRGEAFIPFYREKRNEITNVSIEEASAKLEKHRDTMRSSFMNDFIGELKEKIDEAKAEIASINRELKELPFGSDIYRFVMEERNDRRIFFRICKRLEEFGSAEMYAGTHTEDEEFDHDIEKFMTEILEEEDEKEYTDYRKYFTYDMKILTSQGDRLIEADLSKKQGSASGGEKQTPYFIILAASLMQCYPRNTDCIRLAFIDEAFSALSRERIEQMVKYFEDNGFQVIYAAPPEKIGSIGAHISTTVSLVISGRYTFLAEGLVKADEFAAE